ncbi:hypothetical protein PG993_001451 [Apiospora rasikravindrae]|uniref:G-patch domain-containing protein n=1 Tax=Apiospora rasikravindrae TaxID=990691 RepID=A0ABR1UEB5_9PEZI
MSSLRAEMLDHLLDKFEDKDKSILRKMIQASVDNDDDAALAHRVFKSVVAYVGAHSNLSCLEATALESIQETLANLAETAGTAAAVNGPNSPRSAAYIDVGGEEHSPTHVETSRSPVQALSSGLAKTQMDGQQALVHPVIPKAPPVNYGMKMMMKNGWLPGQGLGARGDGITEPVLSPEQLVPDRKDHNPGVGSQKRTTVSDAAHSRTPQVSIVYPFSQIPNLDRGAKRFRKKQHVGTSLQEAIGQVTDENHRSSTGSVEGAEKEESWKCSFDRDPLLFQSRPRHPNSYCNGW